MTLLKLNLIGIMLITATPVLAEMTQIQPQEYGNVQPIPLNRTTQSPTVVERWGSQMDSLQVQRGAPPAYQYQAPQEQDYRYNSNPWIKK